MTFPSPGLYRAGLLSMVIISSVTAAPIVGIDRYGVLQPVGTILTFDSNDPGHATVIGTATNLADIGAVDYRDGVLWSASTAIGGRLLFHTVDLIHGTAELVSISVHFHTGCAYGGSFDAQGRYWVSDNYHHQLCSYEPSTGEELSCVWTAPDPYFTALAFVGDTLYATRYTGDSTESKLGTMNTTTGSFTPLFDLPVGWFQGMDYDPTSGKLIVAYTGCCSAAWPRTTIYSVDPNTGAYELRGEVAPAATLDAIAVIQEMPPILVSAPSDCVIADTAYTRQLKTSQGTVPLSWTLLTGPPNAQIDNHGNITGWTPTFADMNTTFTFEVQVSNTLGTDTETWQTTVRSKLDFDCDGDIDLGDFGHMQACLSGQLIPQADSECQDAILDGDTDVDTADVAVFLSAMKGPGIKPAF